MVSSTTNVILFRIMANSSKFNNQWSRFSYNVIYAYLKILLGQIILYYVAHILPKSFLHFCVIEFTLFQNTVSLFTEKKHHVNVWVWLNTYTYMSWYKLWKFMLTNVCTIFLTWSRKSLLVWNISDRFICFSR